MRLHFELDKLGRINTCVAGGAEFVVVVLDGSAETVKGKIAERVGADKLANLLDGFLRDDEFELCGRVYAVVARRNGRRATDAHVNFRYAGLAHHAHDFPAGGATNDGIVDKHHASAFE